MLLPRTRSGRRPFGLFIWTLLATVSEAFLVIPFNTSQFYGPDGPWQAVTIDLSFPGSPFGQTVSLLPSLQNIGASVYVPTKQACANYPNPDCGLGGAISTPNITNGTNWYAAADTLNHWSFNFSGVYTSMDITYPTDLTQNSAWVLAADPNTKYPSGKTVGAELGFLSLGGSPIDERSSPPKSSFVSGITHSDSYGMHVGSAALGYTGSLVFGGYDRGRVIGPVVSFSAAFPGSVQLLDVMIGVETGGSPFPFSSQSQLLSISASGPATQPVPALLEPSEPYIYLPQSTIDDITKALPVKLDHTSGYYLWDTTDPSYKKIVSSPAYLGFVFASNVTIKVPFALLNLTLESSITGLDSDVPYFPVVPALVSGDAAEPIIFGRAFLQAAFIGVNWGQNASWLAQAPGPGQDKQGLGVDPVDLQDSTTTLDVQTGDNLFNQSWSSVWTPLPSTESEKSESGSSSSSGLSGGAIAGIVVGVIAIIAILTGLAAFFIRRRRKMNGQSTAATNDHEGSSDEKRSHMTSPPPPTYRSGVAYQPVPQQHHHELSGDFDTYELPGNSVIRELGTGEAAGGKTYIPEMPAR